MSGEHLQDHWSSGYCNDPKFSDRQIWANSVDPDQTAPDQDLHCLPAIVSGVRIFRIFTLIHSFPGGKTGVFDIEELVTVLESARAREIVVIKIPDEIDFANYMVIVTALSYRHIKAVATDIRWIVSL